MTAATGIETNLIIRVEQILEGEAKCSCGKDAVLIVTTEPDAEPGPSCYEHAFYWMDAVRKMEEQLANREGLT